jgi:hypothetical protein
LRKFISLLLDRVGAFDVKIVKNDLRVARPMTADVRILMQQGEPEVIQPVVTDGHCDYWRRVDSTESGTVKERSRQMLQDNECDPDLCKQILHQIRTIGSGAQPRKFAPEFARDGVTLFRWLE